MFLCCIICMYVVCMHITIKQSYTHTVQQMHMQKVVTRHIEAKKVYSHWSQLEYRRAMTNLWSNSSHLDLLCLVATQLIHDTSSSRVIFFQFNDPRWSWTGVEFSLKIRQPEKASLMRSDTLATKNSKSRWPELFHNLLFDDAWMIDNINYEQYVEYHGCFHALYQYLFSCEVVEGQYAKSSWNSQFSTS